MWRKPENKTGFCARTADSMYEGLNLEGYPVSGVIWGCCGALKEVGPV